MSGKIQEGIGIELRDRERENGEEEQAWAQLEDRSIAVLQISSSVCVRCYCAGLPSLRR